MIEDQVPALKEFKKEIVSATGNPLNVKGSTTVSLKLGETTCSCDVIIADIDSDVILGLDFLIKEKGHIDVETNSLVLQGKKYQMKCHGKFGCYRIVVTEKISVPARSEVIVSGEVSDKGILEEDLCIIESTEKAFESGQCVAKSLAHGKQKLPLRMMNLTNEELTISQGTPVAIASPVSEVRRVKNVIM